MDHVSARTHRDPRRHRQLTSKAARGPGARPARRPGLHPTGPSSHRCHITTVSTGRPRPLRYIPVSRTPQPVPVSLLLCLTPPRLLSLFSFLSSPRGNPFRHPCPRFSASLRSGPPSINLLIRRHEASSGTIRRHQAPSGTIARTTFQLPLLLRTPRRARPSLASHLDLHRSRVPRPPPAPRVDIQAHEPPRIPCAHRPPPPLALQPRRIPGVTGLGWEDTSEYARYGVGDPKPAWLS